MAKRTESAIQATVNMDNASLSLTFANGKRIDITPHQLSDELRLAATLHGLKQKLVDAAAISRNPETGKPASVQDKFEAVNAVYERLIGGQWNATREGGGAGGGLLFAALCRMYDGKKTPEALREYLDGKTDAEKTALRKNPRVAAVIEEIRAERGKGNGVDTDELLSELDDDSDE